MCVCVVVYVEEVVSVLHVCAKVKSMLPRLHVLAEEAANPLSTLYPSTTRHWLPIVESIAFSEALSRRFDRIYKTLEDDKEWLYVSVDATLRICMKLKGQESYRRPKGVRNAAPFADDTAWRKLLTVRGRSGAVLMMQPVISEKTEHVSEAFTQHFSSTALTMIQYIATDSPSPKFFEGMADICPNLKGMCLDPIHLAIVYEYAQWNKRTPGSKQLRRLLHKVISVCRRFPSDTWGDLYTGAESRPLNQEETLARSEIWDLSMRRNRAIQILDALDYSEPFVTRVSFIRSLAALCALYDKEVVRKVTGANKEVHKVLWSACAPERLEWLFNNTRVRHIIPARYLVVLPSGTSSNEALHAEINAWTRSITAMHRSTLLVKLRFLMYRKLQAHYMAVCFPMCSITTEAIVLARSLIKSIWSQDEWIKWCAEQSGQRRQVKESLPLAAARAHEISAVRDWVAKKPASRKPVGRQRLKRTPLSMPRSHTLKVSGVKHTTKK